MKGGQIYKEISWRGVSKEEREALEKYIQEQFEKFKAEMKNEQK